MSKTQEPTEPAQVEVNKTVQVIAYLRDEIDGFRDWVQEQDKTTDYFETYTTSSIKRYIVGPEFKNYLTTEEYEALKECDLGELSIKTEETESTRHSNDPEDYFKNIVREIMEDWSEEGPLGTLSKRMLWIKDEDGDRIFDLHIYTDWKPLLKHQSELTIEDMYEDENIELPCVKFKMIIKNINNSELEILEEDVVRPLIQGISKREEFGRIRFAECEQTEKGVCLNL